MNIQRRTKNTAGFTLVEIMIVVAIISLLAAIAIPNLMRARQNADVARIASNLRTFKNGFEMFYLDTGSFPPDSHVGLPAGMDVYINLADWSKTIWGGNYNWEGPNWVTGGAYPYAGISIFGTTATTEQLTALDEAIDNGDLTTGNFRQTPNGRYTYIIAE